MFACGPTGMLKAVGKIAEDFNVPAELSMDEHMCCGVGVCLTCVIPVKTSDGWEYQRTCTEGPVFDSRQVIWGSPHLNSVPVCTPCRAAATSGMPLIRPA